MSKPPPVPWRDLAAMGLVFFAAMLVLHFLAGPA